MTRMPHIVAAALACIIAGSAVAARIDEETRRAANEGQQIVMDQYNNNRPTAGLSGEVRPEKVDGVPDDPSKVYLSDFIPQKEGQTQTQQIRDLKSASEVLQGYHQDPEALGEKGREFESGGSVDTPEANAYDLVRQSMKQERPKYVNEKGELDAMFDATVSVVDPDRPWQNSTLFADCKTTYTISDGPEQQYTFKQRRSCQAVYKPIVPNCEAERETSIKEHKPHRFVIIITPLCPENTPGCNPKNPPAISGQVNVSGYLSDADNWYIKTTTSTGAPVGINIIPMTLGMDNSLFLGKLQFTKQTKSTINSYSIDSAANHSRIRATINLEDAATERLEVAIYKFETNTIKGCEQYFDLMADEFCMSNMVCTQKPADGCLEIDGFTICENGENSWMLNLLAPWHSQKAPAGSLRELAPRICQKAEAGPMRCDYMEGTGECFIAADGEQRCVRGDGYNLRTRVLGWPYYDDCGLLLSMQNTGECTLADTNSCVDGALGLFTGTCYVKDIGFQCNSHDADFSTEVTTIEKVDCGTGGIRCVGTECTALFKENNKGANTANTVLSAYRYLKMDTKCETLGADGFCTPTTANGEAMSCRMPVGTYDIESRDCCVIPLTVAENTTYKDYLELYTAAHNISEDAKQAYAWAAEEDSRDETQFKPVGGSSITADRGALETQAGIAKRALESEEDINRFESQGMDSEKSSAGLVLKNTQLKESRRIDPDDDVTMSDTNYTSKNFRSNFESAASAAGMEITNQQNARTAREVAMRTDNRGFAGSTSKGLESYIRSEGSHALADKLEEMGGVVRLTGGEVDENVKDLWEVYGDDQSAETWAYHCKLSEINLAFNRKAKNCHYVGKYCSLTREGRQNKCIETAETYCCYNSPAVRIVAEKFKGRNGWGTAANPNCGGIPLESLKDNPITGKDLVEWQAIMHDTGMAPGATNTQFKNMQSGSAGPLAGAEVLRVKGAKGRTDVLIKQNLQTITTSKIGLSDNAAYQYDPELMRWYDKTTLGDSAVARIINASGPPEYVGGGYVPPGGIIDPRLPIIRPILPADGSVNCSFGEGEYTSWSDLYQAQFPSPRHPYVSGIPVHKSTYLAVDMGMVVTAASGVETALTFNQNSNQVMQGSISVCPGDFTVAPECQRIWAPNGDGIFWTTTGFTEDLEQIKFCQLTVGERYYLNLKWVDKTDATCTGSHCMLEVLTHLRIAPEALPGD